MFKSYFLSFFIMLSDFVYGSDFTSEIDKNSGSLTSDIISVTPVDKTLVLSQAKFCLFDLYDIFIILTGHVGSERKLDLGFMTLSDLALLGKTNKRFYLSIKRILDSFYSWRNSDLQSFFVNQEFGDDGFTERFSSLSLTNIDKSYLKLLGLDLSLASTKLIYKIKKAFALSIARDHKVDPSVRVYASHALRVISREAMDVGIIVCGSIAADINVKSNTRVFAACALNWMGKTAEAAQICLDLAGDNANSAYDRIYAANAMKGMGNLEEAQKICRIISEDSRLDSATRQYVESSLMGMRIQASR